MFENQFSPQNSRLDIIENSEYMKEQYQEILLGNPDSRKRDDEFSPHLAELPEFY